MYLLFSIVRTRCAFQGGALGMVVISRLKTHENYKYYFFLMQLQCALRASVKFTDRLLFCPVSQHADCVTAYNVIDPQITLYFYVLNICFVYVTTYNS